MQASAGTIVRGLGGEPETLDPVLADDNAALALLQDLFEGLATEAADGSLIPGAAESWSISPDSLRWTFVLRPDLHWSNGDPLTVGPLRRGPRARARSGVAGSVRGVAQADSGNACARMPAP